MDEFMLFFQLRDVFLEDLNPKDVTVRQTSKNNAEFKEALERQSLHFSFQDGRIEAICTSNNEPTWVVNIKRSVLSAFQNSMSNFSDENLIEVGVKR